MQPKNFTIHKRDQKFTFLYFAVKAILIKAQDEKIQT